MKQTLSTEIVQPGSEMDNFDLSAATAMFIFDSAVICKDGQIVEIERSFYPGR